MKKNLIIVIILAAVACFSVFTLKKKTPPAPALSDNIVQTADEPLKTDTVVFKPTAKKLNQPKDFDDDNSLTFKNDIKIHAAPHGDDNYLLTVTKGGSVILSVDSLQGVSKVLFDDDKVFFAVFTFADEDGKNEGYAYVIDTQTGKAAKYETKLHNTCNPVMSRGNYYFWDDGAIIKTTTNFKPIKKIRVTYNEKNSDLNYLDLYSVHGFAKDKDGTFGINFTPDRAGKSPKTYTGIILDDAKVVRLQP